MFKLAQGIITQFIKVKGKSREIKKITNSLNCVQKSNNIHIYLFYSNEREFQIFVTSYHHQSIKKGTSFRK